MSAHLTYLNELLNAFLAFQITKAFEVEMSWMHCQAVTLLTYKIVHAPPACGYFVLINDAFYCYNICTVSHGAVMP